MFGISCPTASLCVAVGGNNTIASSTNPAGGSESWKVVYAGQGVRPTPEGTFAGRQIRGVSCPSPQLCVAVTLEGFIYTSTDPTGDAAAWSVTDLSPVGPSTHMYDISCPSPSFCAASAGQGKIVTSTNPAGGAASWSTTQIAPSLQLRGISCVSPSLCVVTGDNGEAIRPSLATTGQVFSSTDPLGGVWRQVPIPSAPGTLWGVDCPSPALCVTGSSFGDLHLTTDPAGVSAWTTTDGGGSVGITDADCPLVSQCVVIDNNGDVLTSTNPTGGPGAWTFENVIPYPDVHATHRTGANHMFAVSCPTVSFCAAAVNLGQIFTTEDPFVASSPPVKKAPGKKKKKRPRRPRVRIALAPFPTVEVDGRRLNARFRFFPLNRVQVRGFVCKLDGGPFKRCRSPRDYRVALGRHAFRVRAIGWTGLKGPPAVARFRVCRDVPTPMPLPPCWKGAPAPDHSADVGQRPGELRQRGAR